MSYTVSITVGYAKNLIEKTLAWWTVLEMCIGLLVETGFPWEWE